MERLKPRLLDVVELTTDSGRWRAGTVGTIVEGFESGAIVEISDERGHALDLLSLPYDALRLADAAGPERSTA